MPHLFTIIPKGIQISQIADEAGNKPSLPPPVVNTIPLLRVEEPQGSRSAFTDEGDLVYNPPNAGFYHPQATTVDRGRRIMALTQV